MRSAKEDDVPEVSPTIYGIRGLRYFLVAGGNSWLEGLRIIDSKQRSWNNLTLTFYALGTSHALSVRHRDWQVTELLSCSSGFRRDQCLAEIAAAEAFELTTVFHGIRYSFRLTVHSLQNCDGLLKRYPDEDEIAVAYPQQQDSAAPITRLGWLIEPGVLRLETLHTYPEECSGIRTESVLEIA